MTAPSSPVGAAGQGVQIVGANLGVERAHAHREPVQVGVVGAPARLEGLELGLQGEVDRPSLPDGDLPAPAGHPVHGLAELADGATFEREAGRVDEGLLADADGVQTEAAVIREMPSGGAPQRHLPAPSLGDGKKAGQHVSGGPVGSDRIGGHDRRAPDDPIGQDPAGCELQRLVGAQEEGRERVLAMALDELPRRAVLVFGVPILGRLRAEHGAQGQH